jgi:hypothetical protein
MKLNIELNKTYDFLDDGKVRETRRYPVTITDIIPYNEIDVETLFIWKEETEIYHWLYAKETDYFIIGNLMLGNGDIEKIVFVRTKNFGWFSMGEWSGRLDFDGSLLYELINRKKYEIN